jgi:hypothetical protein
MKYIYYILGIILLITIGLILQRSTLRVDVSEPALVINDRIISEDELKEQLKHGSYHTQGGYDAIITRELLIQEALKEGIHKEEAFRASVQSYYEQSLVKTLMDRKLEEFSPIVTEEMVEKFKGMASAQVGYTRIVYKNEADYRERKGKEEAGQTEDFENLSETLRYSLFLLTPGGTTLPETTEEGIVVYRLDEVTPSSEGNMEQEDEAVRAFLVDQGKNAMFAAWMADLKKSAHIELLSGLEKE